MTNYISNDIIGYRVWWSRANHWTANLL